MPRTASAPADIKTQSGRLRWARERAGYTSSRSAAQTFDWNENTYKSHEQGIRQAEGLKEKYLKRYARAFNVSEAWLATGIGSPERGLQRANDLEQLTEEDRDLALRLLAAAKRA
jgi:phage repressor protein C with HTH and peptisase S24 domain